MRNFSLSLIASIFLSTLFAMPAHAGDLDGDVTAIREKLAAIRYAMHDEDAQVKAIDELFPSAVALADANQGAPEPLIVQAAILAAKAEIVGGPSALGDAKKARDLSLAAEKIRPGALGGTAQAILGALYHAVPGWPISFGDDAKAAEFLKRAHEADFSNANTNFYYAGYLHDKGRDSEAKPLIDDALATLHRQPASDVRDGKLKVFEKLAKKIGG